MGNKPGNIFKKKEDRVIASQNRTNATKNSKEKVQNVQNYLLSTINASSTEVAVINNNENLIKAISITETAKRQLDRNGNVLTKPDLIAIVIALEPSYKANIDMLESNTIKDLNVLIRTIIYDPSRYISFSKEETSKNGMTLIKNENSISSDIIINYDAKRIN